MKRIITTGLQNQDKLLKGVETASDLVTSTMGVGGRNVIYEDEYGNVRATKDGVTVARNVNFLQDPVENVAVALLRHASIGTSDQAGDGTTTATLLASTIIKEAFYKLRMNEKLNSVEVQRGIEKATKKVLDYVKTQKVEINQDNALELVTKIATLSANGDEHLGKLIGQTVLEAGKDGLVKITMGKYTEDRVEYVNGLQIDKGLISEVFINNLKDYNCTLKEPLILVTDSNFDTQESINLLVTNALVPAKNEARNVLIISEKISEFGLGRIITFNNQLGGILRIAVVDAPYYGEERMNFLEDVSIVTGATFISARNGLSIKDFNPNEHYGQATEVVIKKNSTIIFDGAGDPQAILNRVERIEAEIRETDVYYTKQKLQNRKARIAGGVISVNIGSINEVEMGERFDRADDALRASKCAIEEGVVSGGGTTLLRASEAVDFTSKDVYQNDHQLVGADIVKNAIKQPFIKILSNAGIDNEDIYGFMFNIKNTTNQVYNPLEKRFVDAVESGILDPHKVTRCALENAVSCAGTFITSYGSVINDRDDSLFQHQLDMVNNQV